MVGIPRKPDVVREESYVKIYNQKVVDLPFHELMELSDVIDDFLKGKEAEREQRRRAERLVRLEKLRQNERINWDYIHKLGEDMMKNIDKYAFYGDFMTEKLPYATLVWGHEGQAQTTINLKDVDLKYKYTPPVPTPKKKIMTKMDDHDPWKINIWCDPEYDKKIKEIPGIYCTFDYRKLLGYIEAKVDQRYDIAEVQNYIESLAK